MDDNFMNERLAGLDRFAAVPLTVDVDLDRLSLTVRDLLALAPGSVLRTSRRMGGLLEVRVGGAAVAQAEIVNTPGKSAVRLMAVKAKKT